jgi:cellulose biosynthesis protein BcsQ
MPPLLYLTLRRAAERNPQQEISCDKTIQTAIVLNQVQVGTVIAKAAQEQLTEFGKPVLDTTLHMYVAYKESAAAGLAVTEYERNGKASQEIAAFYKELRGAL